MKNINELNLEELETVSGGIGQTPSKDDFEALAKIIEWFKEWF